MKLIGLTGGIASGKSTVAAELRALGATVVDADLLARQIVEPGQPALEEIRQRWPQAIDAAGRLDRAALGALVFEDPKMRAELEAITHPRIAAESARLVSEAFERGEPVVFYEAALLVEKRLDEGMDGLVVVDLPEGTQLDRLRARDGFDEESARRRLAAQLPAAEKRARATWIIDNSGTPEQTRAQIRRLWTALQAGEGPPPHEERRP